MNDVCLLTDYVYILNQIRRFLLSSAARPDVAMSTESKIIFHGFRERLAQMFRHPANRPNIEAQNLGKIFSINSVCIYEDCRNFF